MADDVTLDQFLKENSLAQKIGSLTPEEASTLLMEIKYRFPDMFHAAQAEGLLAHLTDPAKLQDELKKFLDEKPQHIKEQIRQDGSVSPAEITQRASLYNEAAEKATKTIKTRRKQTTTEYARALGANLPNQIKQYLEQQARDDAQKEKIKTQLEEVSRRAQTLPPNLESSEDLQQFQRHIVNTVDLPERQKDELIQRNQNELQRERSAYQYETNKINRAEDTLQQVAAYHFAQVNPTTQPDTLFQEAIRRSEKQSKPLNDIISDADREARKAEFANMETPPSATDLGGHGFFRAIANPKNIVQKNVAAPVADFLFDNFLNKSQKLSVIGDIMEKSVSRMEAKIGAITLATGETIAGSRELGAFIRKGNEAKSAGSSAGQVTGIMGDFFGSFQGVDEQTVDYMQSMRANMAQNSDWANSTSMFTYVVYPQASQAFRSILDKAGIWTLKEGAKEVGKKAVGGSISKTVSAGLSKLIGGAAGAPLGPGGAIAGAVLTDVILGKLVDFGGKLASGVGYLFSGGLITSILQGTPPSLSNPFVAAGLFVMAGILIFSTSLLPLGFNTRIIPERLRKMALVTSIDNYGGGIGGGPGGPTVDCTQEPAKSSPACLLTQCEGDCQWPLDASSGACIIEGPFVGTHSSCQLSGIDFISLGGQEKLFGAPVYTPYAGKVIRSVFGFDDNSGYGGNQDGGTYGNHVIVQTSDGGNLLFAHLRNIQTVNEGQSVDAKSVVGYVDHTGYSLGVHLHYEAWTVGCPRGGVDINKYTPFPVPPCEGYADCNAKLQAAGHSACISDTL